MPIRGVEGREREYDDEYDLYNPPSPTEPPRRGPPYTVNNPPPPPRDGYEYVLNPETGEFEERPRPQATVPSSTPAPPPSGPIPTDTGTGGAGGAGPNGNGGFGGDYPSRFSGWPSYAAPDYLDPGRFDPGPAFTYREFVGPSGEDVLNEPGFQFRLDQGRKALEAAAAGRGVLRAGGTLKDILGYGQNFASQEYGNVWNRALQEYDTNRSNAMDTWQTGYGGRRDAYDRSATNTGQRNTFNLNNSQFDWSGRQRQAEMDFNDDFQRWLTEGNWNRDIFVAGAGD